MISKRFTLILFAVLAAILPIAAQDASFTVNSPGNVIEGRRFALTFRLKNGKISGIKAPQLDHCELIYGPAETSMTSSSYINGHYTSSTTNDYTFTYVAREAGKVTVPAVTVSVNGKHLSSQEITFTVFPADKDTSGSSGSQSGRPQVHVDDIDTQTPGPVSSDDLFVKVFVSRDKVYEQEAIIATIKVYTKFRISGFLANTQPSFDNFISEELPVNSELQPDNYNGQNYYSAELKKAIIYPQKSGRLTITSGKYDITVVQYQNVSMGFWTTREPVERKVVTSSNSVAVNVVPLPEPKPLGFSGAVGNFTISSELTPNRLLTNEAANYALTIKGTGNIKLVTEPVIEFPHGFDEYTPKMDVDARFNGSDMTGTARIDYTIVPQEVGTFTLPAVPFSYFNPQTGKYVELSTEPYEVKVGRGANAPAAVEQKSIDKTMTDILHIKTVHPALRQDFSPVIHKAWYWLLYVVCVAILIAIIAIYRKQLKLNSDVRQRQLSRANKLARRRFKAAATALSAHQNDKFYQEVAKALWGFVSDKLGIPASQLIRDNIASQLTQAGAGQEVVESVINILDECEMARFTPQHSEADMNQFYEKAIEVVKQLSGIKAIQ